MRTTCYFTDVYITFIRARSYRFTSLTTTNDCAVILSNENDKWLSFRDYNKKERLLFVVYADLECILEKRTNDENISRFIYQHHKVFSVGYYIRCVYDETVSIYKSYRGEDCVSWFVKELHASCENDIRQ